MSLIAQTVGAKMQELMKQPVIVDNRPGAGGTLGADMVAKSPPDGYTFLLHTSAMSSLRSLYSKLPFDPANDLIPVSMVVSTQFVIVQRHLATALADPEVHKWLDSTGQLPVGNAPAEFAQQFRADVARFGKVIDEARIPKLD
jgi:tripartite-type tricarboxylate transporter receptor subunit TctC